VTEGRRCTLVSMSLRTRFSQGPLRRVWPVVLTCAAALGLVAGILNLVRGLYNASQSERLGESGSRGSAMVTSKDVTKPSRKGGYHHVVHYRVTSPLLADERRTEVARDEWNLLQPGQPATYLYDASDPAGGILEAERSLRESWLWNHLLLLPVIALCGGYLGWRLARSIRGRKARPGLAAGQRGP
jgi:Protein of unknown function (DUF3592)